MEQTKQTRLLSLAIVIFLLVLFVFVLSVDDASAADCGKCLMVRIARAEKAEAMNIRPPQYVPYCFGRDVDGDGVGDFCTRDRGR